MKNESFKIRVNGHEAVLDTYILSIPSHVIMKRRPLVLICPGGGYEHVSEREGEPIALKFNGIGCHAAVLKYSVKPAVYPQQLLETAQAWKIIHDRAGEWGSEKIIICGCSAGAHLAANYAISCEDEFISGTADIPSEKLRPAGMILCYPVITSGEYAHRGSFDNLTGGDGSLLERVSLENMVTDRTPPAFIWHTFTDGTVPVENSLMFAAALRKHNISTELHIFPEGGHGLSLADEITASDKYGIQPECRIWFELAAEWIKNKFGFAE